MSFTILGDINIHLGHLTVKSFKVVRRTTWEACSKWYNIGIELGREIHEVEAIHLKHSGDPERCFSEIIHSWLKGNNPKPTWMALARALREPSVGFEQLAETVEQMGYTDDQDGIMEDRSSDPLQSKRVGEFGVEKMGNGDDHNSEKADDNELNDQVFHCPCRGCSLESYLDKGCPLSKQNSFPFLDLSKLDEDNKEDLIQTLSKDTENIIKGFATLFNHTCKSLIEKGIFTLQVARCALSLDTHESISKRKPLLSECADELRNAKTIYELFIILKPY